MYHIKHNTNTMTSLTNCGCGESAPLISGISKPHTYIQATTHNGGWKLFEDGLWTAWFNYFSSYIFTFTHEKYIFNLETGTLYLGCHTLDNQLVKVGQFSQETEHPYIYMEDCSYIRVLPKYNNIIQNSPYAKKCHQKYIESLKDDV